MYKDYAFGPSGCPRRVDQSGQVFRLNSVGHSIRSFPLQLSGPLPGIDVCHGDYPSIV